MKDRINLLIAKLNLTSSEFADNIDVQRSNISHLTSGRNKPSVDLLAKIKENFPQINLDWLILGQGDMFIDEELNNNYSQNLFSNGNEIFPETKIVQSEKIKQKEIKDEKKILLENIISNKNNNTKIPNVSIKKIIFIYNDNTFEEINQKE